MRFHICARPDFESVVFRSVEGATAFCEHNPEWSYIGEMGEIWGEGLLSELED